MANTTTVNNYTFTTDNGVTASQKQAFRGAIKAMWEPMLDPNPKYPAYLKFFGSGVLSNGLFPTTSGWPTLSITARKLFVPELTKVVFDMGRIADRGGTKNYYITSLGGERVTIDDSDGPYTAPGFYGAIRDSDFEYQNILDATLMEIFSSYNGMPLKVGPPLYDIKAIFSQYNAADVPPTAGARGSNSTTINSNSRDLKLITFYSSFGNTTLLSTNNLSYRIGDKISLQGFKVPTSPMFSYWREGQINGLYTVKGISSSGPNFGAGLYVEGGPAWNQGAPANVPSTLTALPISSSISTNGFVTVTPAPDNQKILSLYINLSSTDRLTLLPEALLNTGAVVVRGQRPIVQRPIDYKPPTDIPPEDNPIVGIFPIIDPYIEPVQTTPTKPVVVTPPTVTTPPKPTPTVKVSGTTVSIPFLTSASFKPGISAAANAKGKAAFLTLVKKASVASKLTKEQDAQLLATVYEAIDKAMLVKKSSLTKLKAPTVVKKNPVKKLNQ